MTTTAALRPLLDAHWYDAAVAVISAAMAGGDQSRELPVLRSLAMAAERVLDLDAEDFGVIGRDFHDRSWAKRLVDASFPQSPRSPQRGALGSLVPLYSLMLEVLQVRAVRHEPLQLVVTAHLIGEYLPLLAWESTLGHAGDPLEIGRYVGERWGTDDPECPHGSPQRATAKRSLNACTGDLAGYTAYLDKFHSRLGPTLAICALNDRTVRPGRRPDVGPSCPNPCGWALFGSPAQRKDLDARVRLALLYRDSPLVSLRHHAPVGHFFGVPSTREITRAWERTWERMTQQWPDGDNPLVAQRVRGVPEPREALPGLADVVSAVAGTPIGPGRLIQDIRADMMDLLPAS